MTTRELVSEIRNALYRSGRELGVVEDDDNASAGFRDTCDAYEGLAFSVADGGRDYRVTVEDVTLRSEET